MSTVITPSLPPAEAPNTGFKYKKTPVKVIIMEPERENWKFLMDKLTYLASRAADYARLSPDDPRRLAYEYKREIFAQLMNSSNQGILDLDELQARMERQKNFDPVVLQEAVLRAIDELGIIL